jgi:WD40 repeat protein
MGEMTVGRNQRIRKLLQTSALITAALAGMDRVQSAPNIPEEHRLTLEDLLSVEPIGETALSPDGKTFATARGGQIVLLPAEGGWPVTLTSSSGGKSGLSWSPDGSTLDTGGEF